MGGNNRILAILLGVLAGLVLIVGGLSAVLLLSGGDDNDSGGTSSSNGDSSSSAATSGRLRLGGTDPISLDPAIAGDAGSATYIVEIFSGLVTISPQLKLELDLAK